ncbi:uncharacterized protein B0I36DRAFT_234103 [Microdochium trichocladiopsis]|uniref:Rhodopsin domain-containing protein n=1 Tax=Microdochium trichocladiopsis TaxID=1682393 RepID=A0A9P8YFT6_9PEZI|nr:uncharacterized protein B0I36DRAFT_234103 [Microdochium trichocladiopsis]KAH7040952.1 hypothetical protein B0I36DRAFT_234103 [Microdochium trichocladiopsis]
MNTGYELACAMWAMTALSLSLVALRLYTRIVVVKFVGAEDYMYACTGVFLLCFTIGIQMSVRHGLGQDFWKLSLDDSSQAIFWSYVANSFAIIGNAMAKLSMGLFLLRVVQVTWHKVALWMAVIITTATSIALTVMLWNQTTPVKASWDVLRTPGIWRVNIQPTSVGLGVWSSICDFFFAIFPWLFIWSLRMSRREKIMLAGGMSVGVVAGACGITRTVVLSRLNVFNYTLNFVPYFAWAAAEIAVAMVCIGVPTLRPLYLKTRGLTIGSGYGRHQSRASSTLPQFEIVEKEPKHKRIVSGSISSPVLLSTTNLATNFMAPIHSNIQPNKIGSPPRLSESSIAPSWPAPTRLSSSPRASIDHVQSRISDESRDHVVIAREHPQTPSSAYGQWVLPRLPPRSDSLRSHVARPPTASSLQSAGEGVIWVRNEVVVEKDMAPEWPLR